MSNMLEFKLLNKDTFDEQCYAHKMVFGNKDGKVSTYWQEKHYDNPLGDSLIFGAYFENTLVGMECFQPYIYECNGKNYKIYNSTDSGVLPEYQGKGIWGKLVRFAEEYIKTNTDGDVLIGFPNYRNSYYGYKKMAWETVFILDNYLLVNNSKSFLKTVFPKRKLLHPILSFILNFQKCSVRF